jgi:predicted protein tyrosine phosphatase
MARRDAFATKLLFVCSRNRKRSLTAERIFSGLPGYEVRSAGTQPEARIVVTEGHVRGADIIFAMERSHVNRMRGKLGDALDGKRVIVLNIPDDYECMQPELIELLEATVSEHLEFPAQAE